jgi:hypothetical protein
MSRVTIDQDVSAGAVPGDEGGGLVVAEKDEHQVVVAVGLHVRHEGRQRVLDGTAVAVAHAVGVALDDLYGIVRSGAGTVEHRAVADGVPVEKPGDLRPRPVAGDEGDLGPLPTSLSKLCWLVTRSPESSVAP